MPRRMVPTILTGGVRRPMSPEPESTVVGSAPERGRSAAKTSSSSSTAEFSQRPLLCGPLGSVGDRGAPVVLSPLLTAVARRSGVDCHDVASPLPRCWKSLNECRSFMATGGAPATGIPSKPYRQATLISKLSELGVVPSRVMRRRFMTRIISRIAII